jgi:hypothetical protein
MARLAPDRLFRDETYPHLELLVTIVCIEAFVTNAIFPHTPANEGSRRAPAEG